jgi:hypothetical protein
MVNVGRKHKHNQVSTQCLMIESNGQQINEIILKLLEN